MTNQLYNENQINGVSIGSMCNVIKNVLNDYLSAELQGIAIISENEREWLLPGYTNCIGPKCLIYFVGESSYGDESISDVTARVVRDFEIIVQRGKILGDPRNTSLTTSQGPSLSFFSMAELIRDKVRALIFPTPMVFNPVQFKGMRAGSTTTDNRLIDSYIISISILCQIPRITVSPPELGGGYTNNDFLQLTDPEGINFNQSS